MNEPPLLGRLLFFRHIVRAGLCIAVPELLPGVDTVSGVAGHKSAVGVLDIVLAKVCTGLTGIFILHIKHLTMNIPCSDYKVNIW